MMIGGCVMWDKTTLEFLKIFVTLSPKSQLLMSCLLNAYVRHDHFEMITLKRAIVGCWSDDVSCLDQVAKLGEDAS